MTKSRRQIRKVALILVLVLLVSFSLSACGGSDKEDSKETLTLYTWAEMFPDDVLDGFTEETGIEVNYVNFESGETMLQKLETEDGGAYDLIIADDYIVEKTIEQGLAQELDTEKLSNYGNINPIYQGQFYDPDNKYTIPYGAGIQTIVYDPTKIKTDVKGYGDLWDKEFKDSLGIIGNFRVIDGMALKTMGESYNTEDVDVIAKAGEKLMKLAPNIRITKDQGLQEDLLAGEISAGVMYTSQVTNAKMNNPDLKIVYPEEGIGFGIMAGFLPSKAPNSEAAYKFMDYIMKPEVGAKCFEYIGYYSTYSASDEYISEDYREFLTLPKQFKKDDMEMIQNISADAEKEHDKIWTEFTKKTGQTN